MRPVLRAGAPLLGLLLLACAGQPAAREGRYPLAGHAFAAPVRSHVPRLARVDEGLYRGGQPDEAGFAELKRLGVRTVVNLRSHHDERAQVESLGLAYVHLPMQADLLGSEPPTEAQLRTFFDVVRDPARRPVFVHCALGQDRTGTMIALYRIQVDGWSNDEAVAEMHAFGYHDFFRDLIDYVRRYRRRPQPVGGANR